MSFVLGYFLGSLVSISILIIGYAYNESRINKGYYKKEEVEKYDE